MSATIKEAFYDTKFMCLTEDGEAKKMSTEKMREEFEHHIRKSIWGESATTEKCRCLSRDGDGPYENMGVQRDWELWQASRAAIEVELPKPFCAYGSQGHHGSDPDDAYIVEDVVRAIESLGLKVKS